MKKKILTDDQKKVLAAKGHGMPVTRRQFLAHGLVEGLGFMAMPTILDTILRSGTALGDECPAPGAAGAAFGLPLLMIDMSGGPILNNFLFRDQGKQMLPSYSALALADNSFTFDNAYGTPLRNGPLRTAMETALQPAGRARTRAVTFAFQSGDDTNTNLTSPIGLMSKLVQASNGSKPQFFANGLGTRTSASGANSSVAPIGGTVGQPFASTNVTGILNAVSPAFAGLSTGQRSTFLNFVSSLSSSQVQKFQGMSNAGQLETALKCGVKRVIDNSGTAVSLDCRTDADVQAVFGITAATNDANARNAQIIYSLLMGHAATGAIEIGGGDNHGQGQATMDAYHASVGQLIGRALELASRKNKNFAIYNYGDGGQSGNGPAGTSDAGDKSGGTLIVHMAAAAPTLVNGGAAGFYNAAQSASTSSYIGASPTRAAYGVIFTLANLLGGGTVGRLANLVDRNIFDTTKIDELILLG